MKTITCRGCFLSLSFFLPPYKSEMNTAEPVTVSQKSNQENGDGRFFLQGTYVSRLLGWDLLLPVGCVNKRRPPAYCQQEKAIFSPNIHATDGN